MTTTIASIAWQQDGPPIVHERTTAGNLLVQMLESGFLRGVGPASGDLALITVHNRAAPTVLERCLNHMDVPFIAARVSSGPRWNHLYKLDALANVLAKERANTILFCDADDCVFTAPPQTVLTRYRESGSPQALFMSTGYKPGYPTRYSRDWAARHNGTRERHLNSGVFIGDRRFLLSLVGEVLEVAHGVRSRTHPIWPIIRKYYDSDPADILIPDQNLFRFVHPRHPEVRVDVGNRLAWRNGCL